MNAEPDPRIGTARKVAGLAWIFLSVFLASIMGASYFLGTEPRILGLPAWVAVGNLLIPLVFVGLLIVVIEHFIPDIPLDDGSANDEIRDTNAEGPV